MTGVVADDKQPRDRDRSRHDHQCLCPPRVEVAGAGDARTEKGEIEQHAQHGQN